MLGAFYLALSTPIAIAFSAPPKSNVDTTPYYLKPIVTHIQPITDTLPPEQSVVPVPAPVAPAPVYVAPAPVSNVVSGCGDNFYANFIYMHESGCDTGRYNSIGCFGIGQSCPSSKIAYCGTDYDCQNAWFTSYANSTYGSWAGAYAFWVAHSWW
jgi:hypothetical protein